MARKKIVIVGVGALGSHVVLLIRNLDATIKVVDFDRVEQKNTLSQFHPRMVTGKNKAQALQQAMQGMFGVRLEAVPHRLTPANAEALLGGADLVVDCLDNGASRRIIQDYIRAKDIACLHGALAPDGQFGRVVWDENFRIDDEAGMGAATCEDGEHLPFIAVVSALLAKAVQRYIQTGVKAGAEIHPHGMIPT